TAFLAAALFGLATVRLESRPIAAGILFGLLCYKPHFGVLVPIALAAGGYWRSFLAAGCSATALVLISLALFGWETWQAFLVTAGAAHSVYESGRILFAGFANPFGAVRLLGGNHRVAARCPPSRRKLASAGRGHRNARPVCDRERPRLPRARAARPRLELVAETLRRLTNHPCWGVSP